MSKGTIRRPLQITDAEFERQWDKIFGKKDKVGCKKKGKKKK